MSYLRDYLNKRDDLGLAVNKEFQPVSVYLKDVRRAAGPLRVLWVLQWIVDRTGGQKIHS